jgi:hypothetical protein
MIVTDSSFFDARSFFDDVSDFFVELLFVDIGPAPAHAMTNAVPKIAIEASSILTTLMALALLKEWTFCHGSTNCQ